MTVIGAFQLARPRGQDLPAKPVKPVKRRAAPGTTRVMDVNGRLGPKLAPNGSQGFAIEQSSLTPEERAANRALADSRADLANQLSRAGVRYPIPAPKAQKAAGKKNPAGVVAPRRTFVNQPNNEANYMPTLPSKTKIALTFGGNDESQVATMTSIELVAFINAHRKAEAEKGGYVFPSKGFAKLEHADFMKKVPEVLGGGAGNFSDTYVHEQNGQIYPAYRFPKREACLMAMSYSYAIQAAVYDHMTALEAQLVQPVQPPVAMPDLTTDEGKLLMIQDLAAKQLALLSDNKRISAELAIAAPKVQALDRIAQAEGDMCITDAAKDLGMKPRTLMAWLEQNRWVYRRGGASKPVAYQDRIQSGHLTHKVTAVQRQDGTEKMVAQVIVTPKGLAKLAEVAA